MKCSRALGLIARATEGQVAPDVLDRLMCHLEQCAACRYEADTQLVVRRWLAGRPDEPLPDGFARRLAERIDREAATVTRRRVAWRGLAIRLVPAAAVLALVSGVVGRWHRQSTDRELSSAVASWGRSAWYGADRPDDSGLEGQDLLAAWLLKPTIPQPEVRR